MVKKIAYERVGKFGKSEYLIPLKYLNLIAKKETEKSYACGEFEGVNKNGDPKYTVFGWVPKSMLVEIEGEKFVPTWIIDQWNWTHLQYTQWINEDYWRSNGSWEVKKLSLEG